jgi:hypothetical protein
MNFLFIIVVIFCSICFSGSVGAIISAKPWKGYYLSQRSHQLVFSGFNFGDVNLQFGQETFVIFILIFVSFISLIYALKAHISCLSCLAVFCVMIIFWIFWKKELS